MKNLISLRIALNFILLALLNCGWLQAGESKELPFTTEKIETAFERAKSEGKLIFVDFSAQWCTPCKWMEETTFKDPNVIEKLNADYIAIKVDIDETEGAIVKSTYNINYLPTLLILNSKGQLVEKVEETLTAQSLINLLERHDLPENRRVITYEPNISPSKTLQKEDDQWTISKDEYNQYKESENNRDYKLQLGVYSSFASANEKANTLKEIFMEPIFIMKENKDGSDIFRVIMGDFQTLSEAESFRKILNNQFSLDSIIK